VGWIRRREISVGLDGVVTFPRCHHMPLRVRGWREVVSDQHLAGTTAMNSGTLELEECICARLVGALRLLVGYAILAGEVRPCGREWGLSIGRVRESPLRRVGHDQVGRRGAEQGSNGSNGSQRKLHYDLRVEKTVVTWFWSGLRIVNRYGSRKRFSKLRTRYQQNARRFYSVQFNLHGWLV
jgi:hypothetical protein